VVPYHRQTFRSFIRVVGTKPNVTQSALTIADGQGAMTIRPGGQSALMKAAGTIRWSQRKTTKEGECRIIVPKSREEIRFFKSKYHKRHVNGIIKKG
jgi:hypothetical protein